MTCTGLAYDGCIRRTDPKDHHDDPHGRDAADTSGRAFLEGTRAAVVSAAAASTAAAQPPIASPALVPKTAVGGPVNGTPHRVKVEGRSTLADLLRDKFELTGTSFAASG